MGCGEIKIVGLAFSKKPFCSVYSNAPRLVKSEWSRWWHSQASQLPICCVESVQCVWRFWSQHPANHPHMCRDMSVPTPLSHMQESAVCDLMWCWRKQWHRPWCVVVCSLKHVWRHSLHILHSSVIVNQVFCWKHTSVVHCFKYFDIWSNVVVDQMIFGLHHLSMSI